MTTKIEKRLDNLVNKILTFGQKINRIKLRWYQSIRASDLIQATITDDPGTWTTLWSRKSGKSMMLQIVMSSLMVVLPEIAQTALAKDFPRLRLFRNGLDVAFAGPKLGTAQIPFMRLTQRAKQKDFLDILGSIDLSVIVSNSQRFGLSNGSTATAFSGSETAKNEGPGAHCVDGDTIIITSKGKITIAELVFRFRLGEKFDILSVGKSGLEFKKCLAVSSEIKKKSLRIHCSNKKKLGLGYEHPVFINNSFKEAQALKIGENVCALNNSKLFSDQHSEMDQSTNTMVLSFLRELSKRNTYFGNTKILKIWLISPLNYVGMVAGAKISGDFVLELLQKLKNLEKPCILMAKKLFLFRSWKSLNHLAWQFGGKMMGATRMGMALCTPNALPTRNTNFFKSIFSNFGESNQEYKIIKNEIKSTIVSNSKKYRFRICPKLLNLISSQCLNIKSESQKNVKSVDEKSFDEVGLVVQLNVKRKENDNMIKNYGQKIVEYLNLSVQSVAKYLRALKTILPKLVQSNVTDYKKISYSEVGDLKKESLLNQAVQVIQIEHLTQEKELFDLMVEGNHNFFANDILVHNCLLVDEGALISPFSMYKILRPMIAHVDGLISITGTPGRKRCPFLKDIEYNKRKFPQLHQEIPYTEVIKLSKAYASYIQKEIDRLPGGIKNPFFRMNFLIEWLIAEGHFIDAASFIKLATGQRYPSNGHGRLVAGVDWGKKLSATTVTILEDCGKKRSVVDLFEIKAGWDEEFEYLVPFLKQYPLDKIYAEEVGSGDPLTLRLKTEMGGSEDLVEGKFMSAPYKDLIFTNLDTVLTSKEQKFEYYEDDTPECKSFIRQFLDAEQEVRGKLLTVHKSDEEGSADDFCIATALANDAIDSEPVAGKVEYQITSQKRSVNTEAMADF